MDSTRMVVDLAVVVVVVVADFGPKLAVRQLQLLLQPRRPRPLHLHNYSRD